MFTWLLSLLCICRHTRLSWPLSVLDGQTIDPYVTCLDCGKEFAYDMNAMQVGKSIQMVRTETETVTETAAATETA